MRSLSAAAVALGLFLPGVGFAQAPSASVSYQFQFINPGARSLGMGGAFTGLSDDATAVLANPAGLTALVKPEISFDLRGTRLEAEYFSGGRTGGLPTGRGIDIVAGPSYATTVSNTTTPAFLSIVVPRRRFVFAFARSEVLRIQRVTDRQGLILRFLDGTDFRDQVTRNIQDFTITSYGATLALKLGDQFSIGGGLSFARFDGSSRELIFDKPQPSFGPSQVVNFSPVDLAGTPIIEVVTEPSDGTALAGQVGLVWNPRPNVHVGASYRRGPRFAIERDAATFDEPQRRTFEVPDVVTAGIAVRPIDALVITSDVSWTDYRDLAKSSDSFEALDAAFPRIVEVHAGVEYVFGARFFPAVRFGVWREPYSGPVTTSTSNLDLVRDEFPSRPAQAHASFGGGLSFSPTFEANGAVDLSSQSRVVSISAIVRFGR